MNESVESFDNLTKKEKIEVLFDFIHRIFMHHALWFSETRHQLGDEKAYNLLNEVYKKTYNIQMKRIAKILNFELDDGLPSSIIHMEDKKLDELIRGMAANWLVNDGIWFQEVEFSKGMNDAKRCNDSCWAHFSPFEAWSIKRMLKLSSNPGLDGLKKALNFRLYSAINKQSIVDENENSFIFRMNECRVQSARKKKNMQEYPCKTAGIVEFSTFAESIDPSIKTECLCCPPDEHPEDYTCAWRFFI